MNEQAQHVANVQTSARRIQAMFGAEQPRLAIVLGSGLGGLAAKLTPAVVTPYRDLPGFPVVTVAGHAGNVFVGRLNGVPVIVLSGRKHFYETNDPYPLRTMIRALKVAGATTLFLSNAAGSLRRRIRVGELMLITDHINFLGLNPLTGPNDASFGDRFVPVTDAWDPSLSARIGAVARRRGIKLHRGVYMAFRGPTFETPAEIRMAQLWGADAVGMSSVPECLIARHCGLKVVGVSCITNLGAGLSDEKLSHKHTMENAARAAPAFERLVAEAVQVL